MTNRERVLATLAHRQPDKVPHHIIFTQTAHARMAAFYGDADFMGKIGNCFTVLSAKPKPPVIEVRPNVWRDPFGVEWDRSQDKDIGVVANRLITRDNVNEFAFPDPQDPSRFDYATVIQANPDGFYVVNHGFSLFERAWTLVGMEELLSAMIEDPPFVHTLLDRLLEFNLRLIDNACQEPIDAMMFGDDWGQQSGLIMGPALWRQFIRPRIRPMYARVKSYGKFVFIHSCGQVTELFEELIDAGLDVFNPFQPEVMDVVAVKKRYGDRLCFYGGISTQRTLPFGTTGQVKDEVKSLLETIGRNGGYFAAPAHAVPADAKPENIAALIEVLQDQ